MSTDIENLAALVASGIVRKVHAAAAGIRESPPIGEDEAENVAVSALRVARAIQRLTNPEPTTATATGADVKPKRPKTQHEL